MAWCYYCRRYTVNGRCPVCNRMYEEPNKKYDFYGREIKTSTPSKSTTSSKGGHYDLDYHNGVWLGIFINFPSIIIAHVKGNWRMKKGAILGTIINSIFLTHIIGVCIYIFTYNLDEIIAHFTGG